MKDKKTQKKIKQMNKNGAIAMNLYNQVLKFMNSSDYNDEMSTDDYIQSVINVRLALAKINSGVMSSKMNDRIGYLKRSLEHYQFIKKFIKEKGDAKGSLSFNFQEQLRLCNEMCDLLPVKIDKLKLGFLK